MANEERKNKRHVLAPIVLAAGAAAAGYYFYGSKDAKRHRQKAAKWADDLKRDIESGVRKLPRVDERSVGALIDAAALSYKKARSLRKEDVAQAAQELRRNWQRLVSEARAGTGKKGKTAIRTAKPKRAAKKKPARSRTR